MKRLFSDLAAAAQTKGKAGEHAAEALLVGADGLTIKGFERAGVYSASDLESGSFAWVDDRHIVFTAWDEDERSPHRIKTAEQQANGDWRLDYRGQPLYVLEASKASTAPLTYSERVKGGGWTHGSVALTSPVLAVSQDDKGIYVVDSITFLAANVPDRPSVWVVSEPIVKMSGGLSYIPVPPGEKGCTIGLVTEQNECVVEVNSITGATAPDKIAVTIKVDAPYGENGKPFIKVFNFKKEE